MYTMNARQRNIMFPVESYNNKIYAEQRWEDDAKIYGDINSEWKISLGNGKRLNRKWKRCGGLAIVQDPWSGQERSIYNDTYDVEWQKAKMELRPPQGLTRQTAMRRLVDNNEDYDMSLQPDDDPDFYSYPVQRSYANY